MKLIVSGATGLLGTEVIRQSLSNPKITSILALTRRPVPVPTNLGKDADISKLKNLVLEDFTKYPDDVKKELGDADACIWTLALTPMKSRSFPWEEVVRVNKDYCLAGLEAISDAREAASSKKTFRYVYVAGDGVPKEGEKPSFMPGLQEYLKMRASTSYTVLAHSRTHNDPDFQATVAKPGVISRPGEWRNYFITGLSLIGIPKIEVSECAAAMLQQCLDGFEKDDLPNADLVRLGRKALEETKT